MSRLKTSYRQAISLSISFSVFLSAGTQTAFAAGASAENRRVGAGFNFTNPTTPTAPGGVAGGEKINLGDLVIGAEEPLPGSTDSNKPSSDVGNDPGINLGNIPVPGPTGSIGGGFFPGSSGSSNIPSNNPYAPWTPFDSYGGTGRPGMLAIPATMVPGVICPLVDNRPNPEIMQAIDQLFQYVIPTGPCHTETDQTKLNELSRQMKESGQALKTIYTGVNSGETNPSEVELGSVQTHIQNLVSGMDTIGKIASSSPLSKGSRCGESGLKGGELVKAMGSLVTSIAPYAILLASIGTGGTAPAVAGATSVVAKPLLGALAKPALKYLLGTFAVGSMVTAYTDLTNGGTIDMEKPDQREALMQNLCEYFRIEQRVNYLKMAEMGHIPNMNDRLKFANQKLMIFKSKSQAVLEQNFPKDVIKLAQFEDTVASDLNLALRTLRNDRAELTDIKKIKGTGTNLGATCTLGKLLAKKADNASVFPGRAIKNFGDILAKQTRVTTAQEILVQTELDLRQSLKTIAASKKPESLGECAPGTQCKPNSNCASIANDYFDNLQAILDNGSHQLGVLRTSLSNQLSENPGFKDFKSAQLNINREILIREKTGKLVAMLSGNRQPGKVDPLSGDSAATVRAEIDEQMTLLKKTLFNSQWGSKSPVYAWLEHTSAKYRNSITTYRNELGSLLNYVAKATNPTGRLDSFNDILKQERATKELAALSVFVQRPGTRANQDVCQNLNNLTLQWHTSVNLLKAQRFFCDSIREMMDSQVQKSIREFCFGDYNPITQAVYSQSEISKNYSAIDKQYGERNLLLNFKRKELKCQVREAN